MKLVFCCHGLNFRFWNLKEKSHFFWLKKLPDAMWSHWKFRSEAITYLKLPFYDTNPKTAAQTGERREQRQRKQLEEQVHGKVSWHPEAFPAREGSSKLTSLTRENNHRLLHGFHLDSRQPLVALCHPHPCPHPQLGFILSL